MKINKLIGSILMVGLLAGGLVGCVSAHDKQARLEARAKVSKADAEKTALAKVPGGRIKDSELEEEGGKLIWTFDIAKEGTKDITEIHVDANTGEVIKVENETAADEAAEKANEKKEKK